MADLSDTKMADPQSLVDAALGTTAATPAAPTPVSEPVTPAPAPSPEPVVAPPVAPPLPSPDPVAIEVTPEPPTTAPTPNVAMGEDTPLAFMTPPSNAPATAEPNMDMPVAPVEPTVAPPSEPVQPAYMSPPPPPMPVGAAPKKKGKGGKIFAMFIGIVSLLATTFYAYTYRNLFFNRPDPVTIANIENDYSTPSACNGACDNGRLLKWTNGRCRDSGKPCQGDKPAPTTPSGTVPKTREACHANGVGNPGFWCGTVDGTVTGCGGFCNLDGSKTCDQLLKEQCDFDPVRGASCHTTTPFSTGTSCDCDKNGSTDAYFDRTGLCGTEAGLKDTIGTGQGYLCDLFNSGACATGETGSGGSSFNTGVDYKCDTNGCWLISDSAKANCVVIRYTCDKRRDFGVTGCVDKKAGEGQSQSFAASCGVEQIDVACKVGGLLSRIDGRDKYREDCGSTPTPTPRPSPSLTPSPSPSVAPPTLACIGLTKDKPDAEIVVGSNLQFTCSGASTPAGAVAPLTYNFRLRIDSGAWQSLPATANKASYTVSAVGDYDVECRVCGTIGAANVCSPTWTGATL